MDFSHCLEKNGILSFLRCEDPLGLAESPGSIAKKMCFKIVLTYIVYIYIHIYYTNTPQNAKYAEKARRFYVSAQIMRKLHVPW